MTDKDYDVIRTLAKAKAEFKKKQKEINTPVVRL